MVFLALPVFAQDPLSDIKVEAESTSEPCGRKKDFGRWIEHVVRLCEAYESGAHVWAHERRKEFNKGRY